MQIPPRLFAALAPVCVVFGATFAAAQDTEDVGETGFAVKRPVLASACSHGCPWGELGDYVKEAMAPLGYEIILCRNCNKDLGPRLVGKASLPPELSASDTFVGTTTRVNAPVDFGITESGFLAWAYAGRYAYESDGPYANLRLIAKIDDPTYLLAAVKVDSPITDLAQIAAQKLPVKILGGGTPTSQPILDYYGLTASDVQAWGGSFTNPIVAAAVGGSALDFDLILNELASPANNPESAVWSIVSQRNALRFLDISDEILQRMADDKTLGMTRATARWGLLRGVDRPISTLARSGHAVFAREDAPEQAAYDIAKAIDQQRAALKWFIRPYSYDPQSVWQNQDVPLHPGAERYYRERGYLSGTPGPGSASGESTGTAGKTACFPAPDTQTSALRAGADAASSSNAKSGGCGVIAPRAGGSGLKACAAVFTWFLVGLGLRSKPRRWGDANRKQHATRLV